MANPRSPLGMEPHVSPACSMFKKGDKANGEYVLGFSEVLTNSEVIKQLSEVWLSRQLCVSCVVSTGCGISVDNVCCALCIECP